MLFRSIGNLKECLVGSLPGVKAHLEFSPNIRIKDIESGIIPDNHKLSAILIIIYPHQGSLYTLVTLRNTYNGAHSGQISFPGGQKENGDQTLFDTALREAHEEIGIHTQQLTYLGALTPFYVHPSRFLIYPYVVFCNHKPMLTPDSYEVKRIIEVDLLKDLENCHVVSKIFHTTENSSFSAPGFMVSGEFMWGASAMIINELMCIIKELTHKSEYDFTRL
mgnify:FL=1